jgi:hypothetical protein
VAPNPIDTCATATLFQEEASTVWHFTAGTRFLHDLDAWTKSCLILMSAGPIVVFGASTPVQGGNGETHVAPCS